MMFKKRSRKIDRVSWTIRKKARRIARDTALGMGIIIALYIARLGVLEFSRAWGVIDIRPNRHTLYFVLASTMLGRIALSTKKYINKRACG